MKRLTKYLLTVIACAWCVALLLVLFFALPGMAGGIVGSIERRRVRSDVFAFVLENKDAIDITSPYGEQAFHHADTGSWDTSVYFGYYFSEDDNYGSPISLDEWRSYKKGIRIDGLFGDPIDWYYTEKICDNWYYYELHDG